MTIALKIPQRIYAFALITGVMLITSCHKNDFRDKDLSLPATAAGFNARASQNSVSVGSLQVITVPNAFTWGVVAVVTDVAGNIYIADSASHVIRKVNTAGVQAVFAGSVNSASLTDGQGAAARFNKPAGLAIDAAGNLYVADKGNHAIRKITPDGVVTTWAGTGIPGHTEGPGDSTAQFNFPAGVAVDAAGNVYVADAGNNKIRKIKPDRSVSTFAGNGTAGHTDDANSFAQFNNPTGIAVDASNNVYIADAGNNKIRIIAAGVTNTFAGGGITGDSLGFAEGQGSDALFNNPVSVTVNATGNVYVADKNNNRIRQISPAKEVSTLAGTGAADYLDGAVSVAKFRTPTSVFADAAGNIFVSDAANVRVREIGSITQVSTLAGNGSSTLTDGSTGTDASFYFPSGMTADAAGNLIVADAYNHAIRRVTPAGVVTTIAGKTSGPFSGTYFDGSVADARFNYPADVAVDATGNIYVADFNNNRIRKISTTGMVSTLAGNGNEGFADGPRDSAMFDRPVGLTIDAAGNLYVSDYYNHRIRKVTPAGVVSTYAGNGIGKLSGGFADGPDTSARFNYPTGLTMDAAGNLYVTDRQNHRIRKITPDRKVTTVAGNGTAGFLDGATNTAQFNGPADIIADAAGNLYVTDQGNHRIRKISTTGIVSTLAGSALGNGVDGGGYFDGPGNYFAQFYWPNGIATGSSGALYIADTWNGRIRKIQ